jgi:adenine-specific DNA-methyltransferase
MDHTSHILSDSDDAIFLDLEAAQAFVADQLGVHLSAERLAGILQPWLVPRYSLNHRSVLLKADVISALRVVKHSLNETADFELFGGIPENSYATECVKIDIGTDQEQLSTGLFAACSNLLRVHCETAQTTSFNLGETHAYIGMSRIATSTPSIWSLVERQRKTFRELSRSAASQFANSAYYMGSKKLLAPFLVESLFSVADDNTQVVDLMCGSGAAAGAFSHFWPTYASDAQSFCQRLAQVQGGGFSRARAAGLLERISDPARRNIQQLQLLAPHFVEQEDRIFHGEFGAETLASYRRFCESIPLYPDQDRVDDWNPTALVEDRKLSPNDRPFCLCTAYFSNVYFGFRQAIEIDSIRFAIDQLDSPLDREWALGALVTTMSAVALSYAGHFAQPIVKSASDISEKNLSRILERRAMSVMHEFSIRLLNLAEESERAKFKILPLTGPWKRTLAQLNTTSTSSMIVYVDAPYKREEYSRYYHVLETICNYQYPSSLGAARIPDKRSGERFRSEFFTRSVPHMEASFVDVIGSVLERNWICAWSYSDNGAIDPGQVIETVTKKYRVRVQSFATPYSHKAQGGSLQKHIVEYLILFIP